MSEGSAFSIIDFHSHILPGADHGSDGMGTTAKQLETIDKAGTDLIVATPHFYAQRTDVSAFLARRQEALDKLIESNTKRRVKIAVGAEVLVFSGMEHMEGIEQLTVVGTDILLLEMPFTIWNNNLVNTVLELDKHFQVVLAHIDRYPDEAVNDLLYMGIHAQLNAGSMVKFGNRSRIRDWLDSGLVVAVGSDLHGPKQASYAPFIKIQKKYRHDLPQVFRETADLLNGAKLY